MIITAIFRSGGTKFAFDKSLETGLPFVGELSVSAMPALARLDKNRYHELAVQPELSFSQMLDAIKNHYRYVILNNHVNPALFGITDYFLTRKDLRMSYFSMVTLMRRQYPWITATQMRPVLSNHTFQIGLVHSYLKENNIVPLYFEDLYPTSKTIHLSANEPEMCQVVDEFMEFLTKNGVT